MVDVQTLQEAFLNMSLSFACFSSEDSFWQYSPPMLLYQHFQIFRWQIKGIFNFSLCMLNQNTFI
jgi:hypothetical protein